MKYKCTFCKHKQNTWNEGRCKKCTCMLEVIKNSPQSERR